MEDEKHRASTAELARAIESLLASAPQTIDQMADTLHYSSAAVRQRLFRLMKDGRVHRQRIHCAGNPALLYRWHAGPAQNGADGMAGGRLAYLSPVQVTVHVYPAVNRRDPMVAAFFGQYANASKMTDASLARA